MRPDLIPVEGRALARDPKSGALVSTDHNKYLQAKQRKQQVKKQAAQENRLIALERQVAILTRTVEDLQAQVKASQKKATKPAAKD